VTANDTRFAGTLGNAVNSETARPKSGPIGNPLLPTDNEWGIPVLRLDRQAERLDAPFARWGRERRKSRMKGTWHFYTDDSRFQALWRRPEGLINSGCVAAVEPNFSVHEQTPRALVLYQTYRKRFLARLWQDAGVRLLVDLNVPDDNLDDNLVGVPKGWGAFATRWSEGALWQHDWAWKVTGAMHLFVVYGGGFVAQTRCRQRGWLWFPEEGDVVRGRLEVANG
jgi:hypothetical protein